MIKDFEIGSYRGIQELELHDLRKINVFVGPNNCGKTSILEAIILSGLFENVDLLVSTLVSRYHVFEPERFEKIFPVGKEAVICLKSKLEDDKVLHTHVFYNKQQVIAKEEPMDISDIFELQFFYEHDGVTKEEEPDNFRIRFIETDQGYNIELGKASKNVLDIKIPCQFVSFSRFAGSGNLIKEIDKVLDQNLRKELIEILNIFDPDIVNFEMTGKRRTVKIFKKNGEEPLSLYDYGNGMYKAFYIATSALLAKNGVLLIDEVEAGIHSKALTDFIAKLLKVCFENNVQLFLTTHSLEAIDIILDDCQEQLEETAIYHIKNRDNKTSAKRYRGNKLIGLRNEIGFDVR